MYLVLLLIHHSFVLHHSAAAANRPCGYFDVPTRRALQTSEIKASGFFYALQAGLWATECCTITAAGQLDEDAPCFKYVPLEVRHLFLQAIRLEVLAGTATTPSF
jgi:hypothetical protein